MSQAGFCALLALIGSLPLNRTGGAQRSPTDSVDPLLTVQVTDTLGTILEARVRIFGSDSLVYPASPDSLILSYYGAGGYCYAFGPITTTVPRGSTRVTVGRGFEYRPFDGDFFISTDTTIVIPLTRIFDMRPEGWYSGDMHSHTEHPPIYYEIDPAEAKSVMRAEGLSVAQFLDQYHQFTGEPHPLSDEETILYFAFEYRNQTYGHATFPGLEVTLPWGCCLDPAPAYPMLLDLREDVVPQSAKGMLLAHPHSTDNYYSDDDWPGAGLGRELPVLAALGSLDALDVVSYGNAPYEDWEEWYDLLSSGLSIAPSAGSDAMLNRIASSPLGGWRVYANLGGGAPLDFYEWVDALLAGRSFLTNYPLIPEFEIDGIRPGETIEVNADTLSATVHLHTLCALGTESLQLVAEGAVVWEAQFEAEEVLQLMEIDTTFTIQIPTPAWIAAIVHGPTGNPHAAIGLPIAHTNAVRIVKEGEPFRRVSASAHWLQSLDWLETLVEDRDNWELEWHRDTVLTRIDRAREFYGSAYVIPPSSFALLFPGYGDSMRVDEAFFEWDPAADEEEGDEIRYRFAIATDSMLTAPDIYEVDHTWIAGVDLEPDRWYWWGVEAFDRGGNTSQSVPEISRVFLDYRVIGVGEAASGAVTPPRARPNPSRGSFVLVGFEEPIEIFDLCGRRVAGSGDGVIRVEGHAAWDGKIHGRPAPAGLYWARSRTSGTVTRLMRVR